MQIKATSCEKALVRVMKQEKWNVDQSIELWKHEKEAIQAYGYDSRLYKVLHSSACGDVIFKEYVHIRQDFEDHGLFHVILIPDHVYGMIGIYDE